MATIPEELLQYKLPRNYTPGTDRISKIVAKHQFTVDLVTISLLDVPPGTYTTGDSLFVDGTECDILYMPRSADLATLSPVVVEFQHTVTRDFMCRAVQYCLNVYKRFHVLPVLFIVCITKMEPKSLGEIFKPNETRPYLLETPGSLFATRCVMLTKQTIDPFIDTIDNSTLDPLVAFGHFLTSGQQRIISIDRWDDPTVINLYLIAMEMLKNDSEADNDKVEALRTICQATQGQFEKIISTVEDNPKQARRYADAGRQYSATLKRKYDMIKQGSNDTPSEATTSLEFSEDFNEASYPKNQKHEELLNFVNDWKHDHDGRMSWLACWKEGREKGLFADYSNSHSLKSVYHKIKMDL